MRRREWLQVAGGAVVGARRLPGGDDWRVEAPEIGGALKVERTQKGDLWTSRLVNTGAKAVAVRQVVLFSIAHDLPSDTHLYGESFQMLSQTGGTLGTPVDLGYPEIKHYRLPQPAGVTALTGLMTLTPPGGETRLLAFTSCRRFSGRFFLTTGRIDVVLDTEGLEIAPGETWELEEFMTTHGASRAELLDRMVKRIVENQPPLRFPSPPAGWCSWYCFGPQVTAKQVLDNLDVIATKIPALKYVQTRRWVPGGDGRLAGDRQGLRRRPGRRAEADPRARVRTCHLGGAVYRRRKFARVPRASVSGSFRARMASLCARAT